MSEERILYLAQKIEELDDRTRAMNNLDIQALQNELEKLTQIVKQQGEVIRTLTGSDKDRPQHAK